MKKAYWKRLAVFAGLVLALTLCCALALADELYHLLPAKYTPPVERVPGSVLVSNDETNTLDVKVDIEGEFTSGSTVKVTAEASGGDGKYTYTLSLLIPDPLRKTMLIYPLYNTDSKKSETNEWSVTLYETGTVYFRIKAWDGSGKTYSSGYEYKQTVTGDDLVEQKVAEIAGDIQSRYSGDFDRAVAAHDWLINHADYDTSGTRHTASGVLMEGKGVAESYARAYKMLLEAMNIDAHYVSGTGTSGGKTGGHTWNKVRMDGEWYAVDCTWDDPGSGGLENHLYFGLNDEIFGLNHEQDDKTYDKGAYPACVSMEDNYYIRKDYVSKWTNLLVEGGLNTELAAGEKEFSLEVTKVPPVENASFNRYIKSIPWRITAYVMSREVWQGTELRYRLNAEFATEKKEDDSEIFKMNFTVLNAAVGDLKDATVTFDPENLPAYCGGAEVIPVYTVTLGDKALSPETDYDAVYENNLLAGTATMKLTGKNDYEGEQTVEFTIVPRPLTDAEVVFPEEIVYTGEEILPAITVKVGEWAMNPETDYTVVWTNNKDASTEEAPAQATITGKDNCTGEVTAQFTILPKELKITAKAAEKNPGEEDPELTYEAEGLIGEDKVEGALTREEGEEIGTYAILQGTLDAGSNYKIVYTGADFVILKPQLKEEWFTLSPTRFVESGKAKAPRAKGAYDGVVLKENDDYEVSYEDNTAAGEAKAVITGKGNYGGTVELTFTILPAGEAVCMLPASLTEMEKEMLDGTAFREVVLPKGKVSMAADCLKGSAAVQVTIPNADTTVDPEAFSGLEGITLIAPAELKIDGKTAAEFCEAQGFCFEEYGK